MYLKILTSFFIASIFIIGCSQQGDERPPEQHEAPGAAQEQQGMPGQAGQQVDIDVSDEEIDMLVEASGDVQAINMGAQQKMTEMIEEEGMDPQRFQEIQMAQQQGQTDASEQEMEQFENIMGSMEELQVGFQEEMEEAIEEAGLTMQRYEQIAMAAQQSEDLMKRIEKRMGEEMQQQAP